jgi:predicted nucleotidyltransferase
MPSSREHVVEALAENRETIRSFGVRRLALFGSCARGEETACSDLDFVVDLEVKSFDSYMGLKLFLEDLFGCRVDLVLQDAIKPRLRPRIMKGLVDVPGL